MSITAAEGSYTVHSQVTHWSFSKADALVELFSWGELQLRFIQSLVDIQSA